MLNEEGRRVLQVQVGRHIWKSCPKNTCRRLWVKDAVSFASAYSPGIYSASGNTYVNAFFCNSFLYIFSYFLPYFILLPKFSYIETKIFWGFLFQFFCSSDVSLNTLMTKLNCFWDKSVPHRQLSSNKKDSSGVTGTFMMENMTSRQ